MAGMTRARGVAALLTFSVLFAALDLVTKHLAFERIGPREVVEVVPGALDFVLRHNYGAAFSLFWGKLHFFYAVSLVAFALLCYFAWSAPPRTTWRFGLVLGLLGGGMLGNLHDRIRFGYVRDFIDVYVGHEAAARKLIGWFKTNHWPTFNVADACIVVGAIALVIHFSRDGRRAGAGDDGEEENAPAR